MKFTYDTACECGGKIVFSATGEEKFGLGETPVEQVPSIPENKVGIRVIPKRLVNNMTGKEEGYSPSYADVVWTETWPSKNWICSSSPPASWHSFARSTIMPYAA